MTGSEVARRQRLRQLGVLLLLLSLGVVTISAYLRLTVAEIGCPAWPGCYAHFLESGHHASPSPNGRMLHRMIASAALLLATCACWIAWRPSPISSVLKQTIGLLGLMLLLSVIGIWSNDPRRVAVGFVNLMGGLGLVSLSARLLSSAGVGEITTAKGNRSPWLKPALVILAATIVFGALIGASYATATCVTLPDCQGVLWPSMRVLAAFDPTAVLSAPAPAGDTIGTGLHLLHRYTALGTLVLLGIVATGSLRNPRTRRPAQWLLGLLAGEILLGIGTVTSTDARQWFAIGHNLGAALLLAVTARLFHSSD